MERRAFLKSTLGFAIFAGATAMAAIRTAEAAPSPAAPAPREPAADATLGAEENVERAASQDAQFVVVRRRRRRVVYARPIRRRRVLFVRRRRRIYW